MGKTEIMRKTGSDHNKSLHPLGRERSAMGLNSEGENKCYPYHIKQERLTWFQPKVSLSNWCLYMTSLGLWLICIRQTSLLWMAFFQAGIWLTIHGDRMNIFPLEISPPECNRGAGMAAVSMCILCLLYRKMETSSLPYLSVQHKSQGPLPQTGVELFVCSDGLYFSVLEFKYSFNKLFLKIEREPRQNNKTNKENQQINWTMGNLCWTTSICDSWIHLGKLCITYQGLCCNALDCIISPHDQLALSWDLIAFLWLDVSYLITHLLIYLFSFNVLTLIV